MVEWQGLVLAINKLSPYHTISIFVINWLWLVTHNDSWPHMFQLYNPIKEYVYNKINNFYIVVLKQPTMILLNHNYIHGETNQKISFYAILNYTPSYKHYVTCGILRNMYQLNRYWIDAGSTAPIPALFDCDGTKAPFLNFSMREFSLAKIRFRFFESLLYLTCVVAVQCGNTSQIWTRYSISN